MDGRQAQRPLQGLQPAPPGKRTTGLSGAIGLSANAIARCSGLQIADAEVSRIPRFFFHTKHGNYGSRGPVCRIEFLRHWMHRRYGREVVKCGSIAHIDKRSPVPLTGPVEGYRAVIGGFARSFLDRQLRQRRVDEPNFA
ncbi:hypothetical protein SVAN01_03883 [Stagonosporopsis vannaccii]|nr:hypothetical protein SVAN01_03883 [Stagonosporopsis vannaccii]